MTVLFKGSPQPLPEFHESGERITEVSPGSLYCVGCGYALSVAIFGGFAPFIATWLVQATGSPVSPTYLYLLPSAVISLAVIWSLKETAGTKLS